MLQQAGLNCTISYQNRNVTCVEKKKKKGGERGRGGGRLSPWPSVTVPQTHSWLMELVTNKREVGLQLVMSCLVSTTGWSFGFTTQTSNPPSLSSLVVFSKLAVGWKFLRSQFSRPRKAKCKNHLTFCNIGLTVEQMSSTLLVFSLDFLLFSLNT